MSAIIEAAISDSPSGDDESLEEVIELGRKALQERRTGELALDLLALDGVRLPLKRRGSEQSRDAVHHG